MRVKPLLNFNLSTLKNNTIKHTANPIKLSKLDYDTVSFTSKEPLVPMSPYEAEEIFKPKKTIPTTFGFTDIEVFSIPSYFTLSVPSKANVE